MLDEFYLLTPNIIFQMDFLSSSRLNTCMYLYQNLITCHATQISGQNWSIMALVILAL